MVANFLDTLSRDEVGAVFRWMWKRLGYRLRCIVDTGGKSLHGWFNAPPEEMRVSLKAALTALGCDPKMFGMSQPVRLPGVKRGEKLQKLLWYDVAGEHRPRDVAEEVGVVGRGLPVIERGREALREGGGECPPELVAGVLHRGCKMVLAGGSKTNKTWSLVDLALSVASGARWWGRSTTREWVLYMNFELHRWALAKRIEAVVKARPELDHGLDRLHVWNLRGHSADISELRPRLERQLEKQKVGLIVLDPAYKLLGDRDENSNGDITSLMNEFEGLCVRTGAALVLAHHFAKGDASVKDAVDRMSGAGAWARDPDAILVLTPHEEAQCYTVTSVLRNLPMVPEFVLSWEYPIMKPAVDLDPGNVRTRKGTGKVCTEREFIRLAFPTSGAMTLGEIEKRMGGMGMSRRTVQRYVRRAVLAGTVVGRQGLYERASVKLDATC